MKKAYVAPVATKIEFNYSQQVVASNGCYWQSGDKYSYQSTGCNTTLIPGTGETVPA